MLLSVKGKVFAQIIIDRVRHQGVCTGPHIFQCLYGLDSGEDVGEIKLQCIVWEYGDF